MMKASMANMPKMKVNVFTDKYLHMKHGWMGDSGMVDMQAVDMNGAFVPINKADKVGNIIKAGDNIKERFGMESALEHDSDD